MVSSIYQDAFIIGSFISAGKHEITITHIPWAVTNNILRVYSTPYDLNDTPLKIRGGGPKI